MDAAILHRVLATLRRFSRVLAVKPLGIGLLQSALVLSSAQAEERRVDFEQVDIISEGTRMTGYVYEAVGVEDARSPVVVMAHGWGGTQRGLRRDALAFARAGYLVLTFDYRGWGESDSRVVLTAPAEDPRATTFTAEVRAVREVVDPIDMGTDWLNALHWIQAEPRADTDRIGIWGTSMSGGFVVYAAPHDPRVKVVHSQVTGTLNGRAWGQAAGSRQEATERARGERGYPEPLARFGNLRGAPISRVSPTTCPRKKFGRTKRWRCSSCSPRTRNTVATTSPFVSMRPMRDPKTSSCCPTPRITTCTATPGRTRTILPSRGSTNTSSDAVERCLARWFPGWLVAEKQR